MKKEILYSICMFIIVITILIVATILIIGEYTPSKIEEYDRQLKLTFDKCGNGTLDVYYSEEDNKCKSTLLRPIYFLEDLKWYILIPLVFGVAIILTILVYFIRPKTELR